MIKKLLRKISALSIAVLSCCVFVCFVWMFVGGKRKEKRMEIDG